MSDAVLNSPPRLSWSSVSSYAECGERWRLERGYGKNNTTWFATVAGSALHELTEGYDRLVYAGVDEGEAWNSSPTFKSVFDRMLEEETREVKASGRVAKEVGPSGGPNKKDYDWFLHYGPLFFQRYVTWRMDNMDWRILDVDGVPGIELEFDVQFDGERVVGYIDRVFLVDDVPVVVDLKTGKEPSGGLQLATYKVGLEEGYGITPLLGYFWMPDAPAGKDASHGSLSFPYDLTGFSSDYVRHMYGMARSGIQSGVFLPNVTALCKGCGVRDYCRAVMGEKRREVPAASTVLGVGDSLDDDGLPDFDVEV